MRLIRSLIFMATAALIFDARPSHADEGPLPSKEEQAAAKAAIDAEGLRGHIRFLADDLLEGRGPGTQGDLLAQRYIAAQFTRLKLQPAAPDGGWYQSLPLVGVTTQAPPSVSFRSKSKSLELKYLEDYIFNSGKPQEHVAIQDAELVFVGYGIVAPEFNWDDYKGVDLKGKVLLMMNNDPSNDPELFAGNRRLYYGRWDYKYAIAAQQGAAGAIIIHTTESAGYPYQVVQTSWTGEEFELRDTPGPRVDLKGWFSEDAAKRVAALSGHDLDALRASAEKRDFKPVPLGTNFSAELTCHVREQETANVLGMLPGTDPKLKDQVVIFMAHHDHLGVIEKPDAEGDRICNGAIDNASGVGALLTIAEACSRLPPQPRSLLFAAVGAEEQGLLGSLYLSQHPPVSAGNMATVINIDGINHLGLTHDVQLIGSGKSDMDPIVNGIAKWQGRVVTADQFPDRGYYYRSDQFSLAKIGVPGVYLHPGTSVIGKPEGWGRERVLEWIEKNYHQPSDEYSDEWDLSGAVADTQLLLFTGLQAAKQKNLPSWTPGDEFEAARKQALQKSASQ